MEEDLRGAAALWWLFLLVGLVMLGVGIVFVVSPHETLSTFTVIAGIVLIIDGLLAVAGAIFGARENRGVLAIAGVISVVAGLVLIEKPFQTLVVLVLIFAVWLIVVGGVRFIAAFAVAENRAGNLLLAVVEIAAGVVIVSWPEIGLSTVAVVIGIVLIVRGLLLMWLGWGLRAVLREPAPSAFA